MDDLVELLIDGKLYGGWEDASISRAMDAAAGTFNLAVTDRWTPGSLPWAIEMFDACEVRIGGETVITGYVDLVRSRYGAESRSISVQGRDRSGDMVDCSAIHKPDEWKGVTLTKLAEILARPFGVKVKAETDVGAPFGLVKLQQGETALEALVRHAKMRKVLVMPDGKGGILLTRTGTSRAQVRLIEGVNILEASGTTDCSERFSEYVVKGQAGYRKDTDGTVESHASGDAKDAYVDRYRPLLLVNSTETNNATARERAAWEANTRLGKSAQAQITVQGWRQSPGGPLWVPNTLVTVETPWLSLSGEMLIREVTYSIGSGGTTTDLDLVSPQAYASEPPDGKQKKKPKKSGKGKGGGNSWVAALAEDAGG